MADQLLAEAGIAKSQLDAIAVGRGPGEITGVRLAIALAQGIALALDRPVVPVSTLAALAMQAPVDDAPVLAAIDARMAEVYVGRYQRCDGGVDCTYRPKRSLHRMPHRCRTTSAAGMVCGLVSARATACSRSGGERNC